MSSFSWNTFYYSLIMWFQLQDLCKKGSVASLGYIHSFNLGTECYLLSCSALAEGEKPGTLYDTVALSLPTGMLLCMLSISKVNKICYILHNILCMMW